MTTVPVQNVDRTRTLYTDLRDEGFQTHALKNSKMSPSLSFLVSE